MSNSVGELGGNSNYQLCVAGSPGSGHRNLVKKVLSGLASSGRKTVRPKDPRTIGESLERNRLVDL